MIENDLLHLRYIYKEAKGVNSLMGSTIEKEVTGMWLTFQEVIRQEERSF